MNSKKFTPRFTLLLAASLFSGIGHAGTPSRTQVVVIGAGLSGLATAYGLKKKGISSHILELTPRIGGRVRTVTYSLPGEPPLRADSGMEEYWESNPAVPLLRELNLPLRADLSVSSLRLEGKTEELKAAETPVDFLRRILKPEELKQLEAFKGKAGQLYEQIKQERNVGVSTDLLRLKDISFSEWVTTQGLSSRVSEWIRISVECEAGTSWSRFSALDGIAEFHIFLGAGEKSYRVIGGNERFTDALTKKIGIPNISVNRMVKKIEQTKTGVILTFLETDTNRVGTIQADKVVTTIPLYRLSEIQFVPTLTDSRRQAIQSQSWGSYFKAHLFIKESGKRFWHRSGTSFLPLLTDSPLGVIYEASPEHPGKTQLLSLLITGDYAEVFNMMPLDNVRKQITEALESLWPGFTSELNGIEFYRYHPRAVAGWPVGRSRFDSESDLIRKPEGRIYFGGDFTESTHSSGAFEAAVRVVNQILRAP